MAPIRWTPPALRDLEGALDYIARDNPQAAYGVGQRIQCAVLLLKEFPNAGYPGRMEDARELKIYGTPYTAIYWVIEENRIEILRLWHEKRNWPIH